MESNKTVKKLTASVISVIIISLCLAITTFAIVYSMVSVQSNLFTTAILQINLNDGRAVMEESGSLLEPGATIKRDFFVENQSTCDIYYKVYFQNVGGGLADLLDVRICDGDRVLAEGKASELVRSNVTVFDHTLQIGEKKNLQILFHLPDAVGNAAQAQTLSFDFVAEAVQVRNNPGKLFE